MANSPKKIDASAATFVGISYVGGGAPVLLEPNAVVTANGNFAGETLTISGLLANDQIGFAGLTVTGNTIKVANNKVVTFTGGTNGQDLVITFGRGVVAHDVEVLLHNLTYSSSGQALVSHTLSISCAGAGHTDLVAIGTANIAPVVDLDAAASGTSAALSYSENGVPKAIAPSAMVSDVDSTDFSGGSLTVAFAANGTSADQLTIGNQGNGVGQIGVSGSNITWGGNVIGTFSGGVNGAALSISFTSNGATPAAVQALARDILYSNISDTPSTAARTVTYTLNDGDGTANGGHNIGSASATINVTAVNDAPTTTPVTLTAIAEDSGARLITQAELLANASDVDGPSLSATNLAINTGNGSLVDNGDGTWSYTPASNDDTKVTFTYTVTDGSLTAAGSASLDITAVNDAPTTTPVTLTAIAEDSGARLITQAELLANASDVDGPSLSATNLAINTGNGSLVDNGDGTWSYTPASNDDTGVTFTYTVTDGSLTAAGSASLDITAVNDAPTTTPVTLTAIAEDSGARLITQAELLAQASDVDSPTLAATGLAITSGGGTLLDNGDGTWTYTPAAHDDTSAVFSYTVTDGALTASGTASLDITPVNNVEGPAIHLTDPISGPPGPTSEYWSDDGTRLILASTATLTADDTDGGAGTDLFVVNLATGTEALITASIPGGFEGDSWVEATSPDATKLVLGSTSTLAPDDTDAGVANDFYLYDFATGTKTLLTEPVSGPHGDTSFMGWSSDGTKLLLQSTATLTADDTDGGNGWDVFAVDAATGAKTLLTASLPGGAEGSFSPASWSPHGTELVIQSTATLTADDTDGGGGGWDLYLVDAATSAKTLLTAPVAGGSEGSSQFGAWSPDGSRIAFTSNSALTSDALNDHVWDVYVADVGTGEKTLLTAPIAGDHGNSDFAGWSPDGATLLISTPSTLTANDTDGANGVDLYAVDIASGEKTLLTESVPGGAEGDSWLEGWSPDGSKIVIGSDSTLTVDDTDGGVSWDLYAIDLASGQKTLLSGTYPGGAEGQISFAGWSPDGTKILLASTSTLTADDTDGTDWDLFSFDLATGTKTLLTAPAPGGVEGDSDFVFDIAHGSKPVPVWSADGDWVRIVTSATLVNADTDNGGEDLYWVDAATGAKTFTDLGIDQQPGQYAWAETAGPESPTLVGVATDHSDFYLLV